jgi:hypothetical protein
MKIGLGLGLFVLRRRSDVDVTPPTITTDAAQTVDENEVLSVALTANESVAWTITGGADQTKFEIAGTTLRWAADGTKDFEAPDDANTDNAYVVQVTAEDGGSNLTNKTITVTVQDVAEGGGGPAYGRLEVAVI